MDVNVPNQDLERSENILNSHTNAANHTNPGPLSSTECRYIASRKSGQAIHLGSVLSQLKVHKCPKCDYHSSQKGNFLKHIHTVHPGMRPFKCSQCDYSGSHKSNLDRHIRAIHLQLRPHKCSKCDYSSSDKGALRKHIQAVHLQLRPHKCSKCDFSTNQMNNLKRHIKACHLHQKPYKCLQCDYSGSMKTNLDKHMKSAQIKRAHGQTKTPICNKCESSSSQKCICNEHIESARPQGNPFQFANEKQSLNDSVTLEKDLRESPGRCHQDARNSISSLGDLEHLKCYCTPSHGSSLETHSKDVPNEVMCEVSKNPFKVDQSTLRDNGLINAYNPPCRSHMAHGEAQLSCTGKSHAMNSDNSDAKSFGAAANISTLECVKAPDLITCNEDAQDIPPRMYLSPPPHINTQYYKLRSGRASHYSDSYEYIAPNIAGTDHGIQFLNRRTAIENIKCRGDALDNSPAMRSRYSTLTLPHDHEISAEEQQCSVKQECSVDDHLFRSCLGETTIE